jgi:LuxR family quorum sensing-dependent transcriptional regulator
MTIADSSIGIFEEAAALAQIREAQRLLETVERRLHGMGATHFFAAGLPMPGRPLGRLLLRFVWPDCRGDSFIVSLEASDPLVRQCLVSRHAFTLVRGEIQPHAVMQIEAGTVLNSELVAAAGPAAPMLVAVPIHDVHPFQGCVVAAGRHMSLSPAMLCALEFYCAAAFRQLMEIGRIDGERPGDLSERERRVLELTAVGKTANEIAGLLQISQRTVHAHLQNASDKLNASNKTHTVIEALRYGQISIAPTFEPEAEPRASSRSAERA